MLELKKTNWEEVDQSDLPVIVDFWASWCGPCMAMAPVFERVSKQYEGKLKFGKVNTEEQKDLAVQYEIRSIPCLVVFSKGKEVARLIGFKQEDQLKNEIDEVIAKL
ncbi:thioredoxin [Candidatus Woesearchaeota archaeon]|nr:thioredoxin [Candidatus Woesearchaeota archaeon]